MLLFYQSIFSNFRKNAGFVYLLSKRVSREVLRLVVYYVQSRAFLTQTLLAV